MVQQLLQVRGTIQRTRGVFQVLQEIFQALSAQIVKRWEGSIFFLFILLFFFNYKLSLPGSQTETLQTCIKQTTGTSVSLLAYFLLCLFIVKLNLSQFSGI